MNQLKSCCGWIVSNQFLSTESVIAYDWFNTQLRRSLLNCVEHCMTSLTVINFDDEVMLNVLICQLTY